MSVGPSEPHRRVGIAGLVAAVWLVIGNVTHSIGTIEIYTEGVASPARE